MSNTRDIWLFALILMIGLPVQGRTQQEQGVERKNDGREVRIETEEPGRRFVVFGKKDRRKVSNKTNCTVSLQPGDRIVVSFSGPTMTYFYKNQSQLTFKTQKNTFFANGKPCGAFIRGDQKIPASLSERQVKHLHVKGTPDRTVLMKLKTFPFLQSLRLEYSDVTNEDLSFLSGLTSLRSIILTRTKINDRGLSHLSGLSSLRNINLNNTDITDKGLSHLSDLPRLRRISLKSTNVTASGIERFKQEVIRSRKKRLLNKDFKQLKGESERRVQKLIQDLGVKDYNKRQEALEKLLNMGMKAMYYLKRNYDHRNPEIRHGIQRILRALQFREYPRELIIDK